MAGKFRKEKDALGEVLVPREKYFGAQTQRACENFQVGEETFPMEFIRAHAIVKKAAARVHEKMGLLSHHLSGPIRKACNEVIEGKFDEHFPLCIWQSGSGTQTNMNVNEVIANRANEIMGGKIGSKSPVHPNDHVNMSQSTNDTVPTSIHISAVTLICEKLFPALEKLAGTFEKKAESFRKIIKIGRTHLQDATPLTLGQEFSGYAAQLRQATEGVSATLVQLSDLAIGGTAVGTGMNSKAGFDTLMVEEISRSTGIPFTAQKNKFAGLAAHDAVVSTSGSLKTLAGALMKITNDLRWLGSGPRSGLGELSLPANEPGSSIMPGKVNPTQCEMVTMVVCQVYGNDTAISFAGSQGNFELNVFKPLLAHSLIQSINLLADACLSFNDNCVVGIDANKKDIETNLKNSLMLVTALNSHIGYDKAAEVALTAWHGGKTLKEAATRLGFVTEKEFDNWVRPENMVTPDKKA
ncbi:MAG: class II fumarate hydratase [Nitrospinota bacterium]